MPHNAWFAKNFKGHTAPDEQGSSILVFMFKFPGFPGFPGPVKLSGHGPSASRFWGVAGKTVIHVGWVILSCTITLHGISYKHNILSTYSNINLKGMNQHCTINKQDSESFSNLQAPCR